MDLETNTILHTAEWTLWDLLKEQETYFKLFGEVSMKGGLMFLCQESFFVFENMSLLASMLRK